MSLRLSRGEAEGEPETRELCRAPNPRTRYSLSNLYHPGMLGFERIATRRNKKCGLCLYLIHTFAPIVCIKIDIRWYKYIHTALARICTPLIVSRSLATKMNLHKIPAFTPNFSIKLTCCVPEPVMMLYIL